jgi:hypothetical protein
LLYCTLIEPKTLHQRKMTVIMRSPNRRLPDSMSRGVDDSPTRLVGESPTPRLGESPTPRLGESESRCLKMSEKQSESLSRGVDDSPTRRVGESPWWGYSKYFKFIIDFPVFKRVNQAFKIQIWQKGRQGCYVLLPLTDLKVWKKLYPKAFLSTPRLGESGSRFSITNISANTKPKAERLER